MWQGIERKARFQGQVIHSGDIDPTVRSIDDLDSEIVLSYAELKAISTGNPLIRLHAEATAEQARLARLATNHAKTQRQLPARIASLERQITTIDTTIDGLRTLDAKRVSTKADAFGFTSATSTTLCDRSEAGEWLRGALAAHRGDTDWVHVGDLGGQRILGRWWQSKHRDVTGFEIGIAGLDGEITYETRDLWDAKPHTIMTRIERRLAHIPVALAETESRRVDLIDQRQRAIDLTGSTFPHGKRLDELSASIRTMETEMAALERPDGNAIESVADPDTSIEPPNADPATLPSAGLDVEPPPPNFDAGGGLGL